MRIPTILVLILSLALATAAAAATTVDLAGDAPSLSFQRDGTGDGRTRHRGPGLLDEGGAPPQRQDARAIGRDVRLAALAVLRVVYVAHTREAGHDVVVEARRVAGVDGRGQHARGGGNEKDVVEGSAWDKAVRVELDEDTQKL